MRLGLVIERKRDFPRDATRQKDADSELLSEDEFDELSSGLRDAGHTITEIGDCERLVRRLGFWRRRCDIVFNRSVGYVGIERKLVAPAILEAAGLPYVGSTPYVQMLTRHKFHTKVVMDAAGLATSPSALVLREGAFGLDRLTYPAIVKPVAESSSIGITSESVVMSEEDALARAALILDEYRQPAIIEGFVPGLEFEVPIVADPTPRALGVVAITKNGSLLDGGDILSSDGVYGDDYGFATPPRHVDVQRLSELARRAASALGIRDYGRVDMRLPAEGVPSIIEVSTQPHLQRHSSFYEAARQQGLSYSGMLDVLIRAAARRYAMGGSV